MSVVTHSEIRSPRNGRVPAFDSPAVSTRARARITVTVRIGKIVAAGCVAARRWWGWTARPLSLRATWALSAVDGKRIPADSKFLRRLWKISNSTDRLVMFALILLAPTAAQGPLRWLAARPTRRWGFYLTTTVLAVAYLIGKE